MFCLEADGAPIWLDLMALQALMPHLSVDVLNGGLSSSSIRLTVFRDHGGRFRYFLLVRKIIVSEYEIYRLMVRKVRFIHSCKDRSCRKYDIYLCIHIGGWDFHW